MESSYTTKLLNQISRFDMVSIKAHKLAQLPQTEHVEDVSLKNKETIMSLSDKHPHDHEHQYVETILDGKYYTRTNMTQSLNEDLCLKSKKNSQSSILYLCIFNQIL